MAQPRFNGREFTNPLNPLGFHSENRYREPVPLGSNFMSDELHYGAETETRVFETGGVLLSGTTKTTLKTGIKRGMSAAKWGGKAFLVEGSTVSAKAQKALFKEMPDKLSSAIGKKLDEILAAGGKTTDEAVQAVNDMLEKSLKNAVKNGKLSKPAADALMDGAKRGGDDALKGLAKGGAEAAEEGLMAAAKRLPWLRAGGAVGLGVGTVYVMSNVSSALGEGATEWVNDFTGGNCNEKADDQGLEEGTDEFREEVEECQDAAAVRIMVATGLGVVCLFGFLYFVIKR